MKLMLEKLNDIIWEIRLLIRQNFRIYKTYYDIRIIGDEENCWWSDDFNCWVPLETKGNLSSSRSFLSKRKAFKHFDDLTKKGIECKMNDRKIKFWKAWYFENEWYATDQEYFGCKIKGD